MADHRDMTGLLHRRFLTLLVVLFAAAAFTAPLNALLPAYMETALGRPTQFTGRIMGLIMAAAGIWFLVGGALADMLGAKRTLVVGLAAYGVCGSIFLVSWAPLIVGLAVVIGLGFALQTSGAQSYLLGAVHADRMGMGAAMFFVSMNLGSAVGAALLGPLADRLGYPIMGSVMLAGLAVVIVASMIALAGQPAATGPRRTLASMLTGYGDLWSRVAVRWLLATRFLTAATWGMATFAFPYLLYKVTGTNKEPAYFHATSLMLATGAQFGCGRLCDRLGVRWPVRILAMLLIVCFFLTALCVHTRAGLWIGGIAITAVAWSLSTTMPALMRSMTSESQKGRIVGATHVAWAAGMVTGQVGGGWLLDPRFDPAACYFAASVCCAAGAICAWMATRPFPGARLRSRQCPAR